MRSCRCLRGVVPTRQAASRWPRCKQAEFGRPREEGTWKMIRSMFSWWLRQSEMRRAAFASKLGSLLPGPYSRSVTRCTFRSSARDAVLAAPQWMALCSCGCCRMKATSPVPSTRAQKCFRLAHKFTAATVAVPVPRSFRWHFPSSDYNFLVRFSEPNNEPLWTASNLRMQV